MDVAFGAIGVAGVAAQLFGSIVSMYQLLSTANGLSRDAPIAIWKLKIQETRFIVWGRYWGVESGKLDIFLEKNGIYGVVIGILRQIEQLLSDEDNLKSKYHTLSAQITSISQITSASTTKEKALAATTPPKKGKWKTKLRWAIVDKVKFEDLINDLKDFNDGLYSILRLHESLSLERIIQSDLLRGASTAAETRHMREACSDSELQAASKEKPRRAVTLYKDISTSAQAKLARISSSDDIKMRSSQKRPRAVVDIPRERTRSEIRTLATYRHLGENQTTIAIEVEVEWKDFDPQSPVKTLIENRVDSLAYLFSSEIPKPVDFRILECLGYFEDNEFPRYGMMFRAPVPVKLPPVSLYDILGNNEESSLPNLGDKFDLAKSLAISIIRLHDCGWIHGAFRSSNIIFFPPENEDNSEAYHALQDPYIVGFNYSRPSDPTQSTLEYSMTRFEHVLYRHPQVAQFSSRQVFKSADDRQKFQMEHDLYALGVILLEIGLWRRVGTLWKDKYDHQRFSEKLINAYVPRLGPKKGTFYRDAVRYLLGLKVGEEGEVKDDQMSQWSQAVWRDKGEESGAVEIPRENEVTKAEAVSLENDDETTQAFGSGRYAEIYWSVVQMLGQCYA